MKRIGCFLLVVLLLTVLAGGISCQGKTPEYATATPEGTVRLFLDAYSKLDVEKTTKCFVEEDREELRKAMAELLKKYKAVSFSEVKIETLFQSEDTAKVRLESVRAFIPREGPQNPGRESVDEVDLVKQGDKWLIKTPR